jgi:hypothetical protein
MTAETGKYMIIGGVALVMAGIVVYFFHDRFGWLGRLPGDIRVESENGGFYFPVVTCIVISIVGSLILYLLRRFF